jgi:tRNA threonylcarbamoyladenosine biosynthesis protein TsaE
MNFENIISNSPEKTKKIASEFSKELKIGDIIILSGNLGVGKTCFVKGLASNFGILEDEVTSPSFKILNQYVGDNIDLYHFDFYRLHYEDGFPQFEWDEITENGIAVIEWGDNWSGPANYLVSIESLKENNRKISIKRIEDEYISKYCL